jgi:ankyrin repeat protein
VDAVDNEQHSALHWAIVCGELEALDLLHRAGADPSIPDTHGALPIHYAVQMCGVGSSGNREKQMVCQLGLQRLLSMGVDIRARDREGRDPLLWAASAGSQLAVRALVAEGASAASQDRDGLSGLHCAASRGHADTLVCLVQECGADPAARDSNGCTPLFYSVTLGHRECSGALLRLGRPGLADCRDRKERTAAHCGAARGRLDSLKVTLARYIRS